MDPPRQVCDGGRGKHSIFKVEFATDGQNSTFLKVEFAFGVRILGKKTSSNACCNWPRYYPTICPILGAKLALSILFETRPLLGFGCFWVSENHWFFWSCDLPYKKIFKIFLNFFQKNEKNSKKFHEAIEVVEKFFLNSRVGCKFLTFKVKKLSKRLRFPVTNWDWEKRRGKHFFKKVKNFLKI